jgi:hypothetical protein
MLIIFTQRSGSRMALYGAEYGSSGWTALNAGVALDDPAEGYSECPDAAPDGNGGAVIAYTQQVGGVARLFAARYDAQGWTILNGGICLSRTDIGNASGPRVAVLSNGHILVGYIQEDENYIQRLYGSEWNGSAWLRLNAGAPLDGDPSGIGVVAAAPDGPGRGLLAYATSDQVNGTEPDRVFSILAEGMNLSPMNEGARLEGTGSGAIPAVDLAVSANRRGLLVFERMGGIFCRPGDFTPAVPVAPAAADQSPPAAPAASPPATAPSTAGINGNSPAAPVTDGMRIVRNVFMPGRGERARFQCSLKEPARLRLALYSVTGRPVRVLADSYEPAGVSDREWDGRNSQDQQVAAGVYLLVADTGSARKMEKLVVLR